MAGDDSGTLYSVVLTLTPAHEARVRATMGAQAHAAFLHTVREADPALAEVLHAPDLPMRPFTVSPLHGVGRARDGMAHLSPGRDYWLRFTILYPPIFERFMARFLHSDGRPAIRLGRARLLIREILATPESHPWAGYTTWGHLAAQAQPTDTIVLEFVSPTAFSFGTKPWGRKVIVLPEPDLVFGSLVKTWNALAPAPLQIVWKSLKEYVEEHVVIKRLEGLETKMHQFRKAPQVGFIGRVTYGLMADDDFARAQLNALADFAFYAGVGMKRAMGMGQARRVAV